MPEGALDVTSDSGSGAPTEPIEPTEAVVGP
jgi:hypothetical protein